MKPFAYAILWDGGSDFLPAASSVPNVLHLWITPVAGAYVNVPIGSVFKRCLVVEVTPFGEFRDVSNNLEPDCVADLVLRYVAAESSSAR